MTTPHTEKDPAGVHRLIGRRFGQVHGTVLTCPDGHRTAEVVRPGDSHFALRCQHARGAAARGVSETAGGRDATSLGVHWLYLLPTPDGGTLPVECHRDEVLDFQRRRLSAAEVWRELVAA